MIGQVYLIRCKTSNKTYVGITTVGLAKRWYHHVRRAYCVTGGKRRRFLEMAIAKYGEDDFDISALEECSSRADLVAAEIKWIRITGSFGRNGYNMTLGGDGVAGMIVSAETRAKQSAVRTGMKRTAETKAKIGNVHRGKKLSPEHIQKMRERRTGCKLTDSAKAAISRPVIIDGVKFSGVHAAAACLGIQLSTLNRRIERSDPGYVCLKPLIRRPKKSLAEVERMRLRNAKPVVVEGVRYPSITAAALAMGLTRPGVAYRIRIAKTNYELAA